MAIGIYNIPKNNISKKVAEICSLLPFIRKGVFSK